MITIDDFAKVEISVGEILSAEKVPDSNKLYKLSVSFGEENPRQVVSGIAKYFPDPAALVGKKCAFCTNLAPRMMAGLESQGMILAVSTDDGKFSLLEASAEMPAGVKVH